MTRPNGRPTMYTEELATEICEAIATSTLSIKKICALHDNFPSHETIFQWRYRHPFFADQYTQAKRAQAELLAEEIIDIADDGSNDTYVNDEGEVRTDNDEIMRSRLRVDTRKWIACRLAPKLYGDTQTNNVTVKDVNAEMQSVKEIASKCMKSI